MFDFMHWLITATIPLDIAIPILLVMIIRIIATSEIVYDVKQEIRRRIYTKKARKIHKQL